MRIFIYITTILLTVGICVFLFIEYKKTGAENVTTVLDMAGADKTEQKEYTNSTYNFSTMVPDDWMIDEKDTLGGFTLSSKDNSCVIVGGNLGFGLAEGEGLVTTTEEVVTLRSGQIIDVQVTRDKTGEAVYAKPVDFPTGDGILIKNGYKNDECKETSLQILSAFYFN